MFNAMVTIYLYYFTNVSEINGDMVLAFLTISLF